MTTRVCRDCRAIYNPSTTGARSGRCPNCARLADRARGTTTQRGYGTQHQRRRATIQATIDAGTPIHCWRCGKRITGRRWALDHAENRATYRGPACEQCNGHLAGRARHGLDPD